MLMVCGLYMPRNAIFITKQFVSNNILRVFTGIIGDMTSNTELQ